MKPRVHAEMHMHRKRQIIVVQFNYAVRHLGEIVPGAHFSKTLLKWTVPCTLDACTALRVAYGKRLEIGPKLWAWAAEQKTHSKGMRKLGRRLEGVELSVVPSRYPRLATALYSRPYQPTGVRFIAEGQAILLADTPGLGKTLQTIGGIVESGVPGPYLVSAPKTSLDAVWRREVARWLPDQYVGVAEGGRERRNRVVSDVLGRAGWLIVNSDMLRARAWWECRVCKERFSAQAGHTKSQIVTCDHGVAKVQTVYEYEYPALFDAPWGALVMDECQRVLIRNSGRVTQARLGATRLALAPGGRRIALSGTPMRGNPLKLWGIMNWLRPKEYSSYWNWAAAFWEVEAGGYMGARTIGRRKPDMEKRLMDSLDTIMLRRTKREVSPDLPRKDRPSNADEAIGEPPGIWLDMLPQQARVYKEMLEMGLAQLESGTLSAIGTLAELTRLKQFATTYGELRDGDFWPALPSNKFDWLVQFLTDMGIVDGRPTKDAPPLEPQGKVVIVSQFTRVLEVFQAALDATYGTRCLMITGNVTGRRRLEAVDLFNDMRSGWNVLFLNTVAGGVAITLDAADDMVFLDETHVPDDQEQAEDRIDNRRPEEKVARRRYWYLKSVGTVEEAISRTNVERDDDQKFVLDGRRGVEFTRSVVKALREVQR